MAYRKTYREIKDKVGIPIGMCGNDPDLISRVNEASSELWNAGDFLHKFARYKLRVTSDDCGNQLITWPHQIETIEALNVCGSPIGVRNIYFEFIENCVGSLDRENTNIGQGRWNNWRASGLLGDREEVCAFEDIQPGGKKVKAYSFIPDDDGTQIIIMGYNDQGNWIRTKQGGAYVDGEYLALSANTPPTTTNFFSAIAGIQFSKTPRNGDVTITQVDTNNLNEEKFLSTYGYYESVPIYRRSILTGLSHSCGTTVTALCRLRFIPIVFDTDYLQIGNLSALKDMLISLQKRDNGKVQDAEGFRSMAIRSLNNELQQYQGISPKKVVSFQKRELWGAACNMR